MCDTEPRFEYCKLCTQFVGGKCIGEEEYFKTKMLGEQCDFFNHIRPIDTSEENCVKCPYCGFKDRTKGYKNYGKAKCKKCDRQFYYAKEIIKIYRTEPTAKELLKIENLVGDN